MIILITGTSHVGKTALAQKLLEKYKYPYLSIDHLKMGLIRSGYTNLTVEQDDELTALMWPIVREMIKTAIENKQNLIVEGCYIPFDWETSFEVSYREHIRAIRLIMSSEYIETHFDEILSHASDVEHRLDDSDCTKHRLIQENQKELEGSMKFGCKYILIDKEYKIGDSVWLT